MKVKEPAQNPVMQFDEAINGNAAVTSAVSKQYLESVRGHYLSALAGLNIGKQEQAKFLDNVDAFSALEDIASEKVVEAEQTSMEGQLEQGQTLTKMDMQIHLSKGFFRAPEKKLRAIKVQLNKTLAKNNEEQISEVVRRIGPFGHEMEAVASELEANETVFSESVDPKESVLKGDIEGSSLQKMVKSLKAELENLKKEHSEIKGAEFAAGNLHFKLLKSKFEEEGFLVNETKVRQTLEAAGQDQQEVEDMKIKGKGLKRERETSKVSFQGEKKSRVALDVDEVKETKIGALAPNKSLSGRIYPACVSTSESSARMMISEDELEASSLKEEKSDKLERAKLAAMTGVESEKYDNASEFSIRDFVFAARNKDISLNWPFSQKNLQLCLKCGVKDLLPPFKPMDSLRDSSMKRFVAETSCNSEESNLDNRPLLLKKHLVIGTDMDQQWSQELGEGYRDSESFPSGGEKDLAFKTTGAANSEVESVSTSNLPLSEVSDERVAAASTVNDRMKSSTSQLSDKKCQVVVKIRTSACRSAAEDITSACTVPSEAMTSKICPVCEAFSSSSNTTLNAHIDQCLSSQSTPNWGKNSKLVKPRVKPRKIRLMSDICATAPSCTLEDLDRRNGTNWATNIDCSAQETELLAEGKSHRVSSRYLANNGDDGAVYIDSNGTKIRILSKFNDTLSLSLPKGREDLRPEKQSKKGKTSRFFSSTRKRRLAKHLKYLKVNRQKKRFSSLKGKGRPNEVFGAEGPTSVRGEKTVEEQGLAQFAKTQEQENASVSGSSRQWISSKRSTLSKKCDYQDINRHCRYELRTTKERQAANDPSDNGRMHIKKHSGALRKCISAQQNGVRTPALYGLESDKRSEGSCRMGGPSWRGAIQGNRESYLVPPQSGAALFNGENADEDLPKSPDSTVTPSSSLEGEVDILVDAVDNVDSLFPDSRKLLDSSHVGPFEGMRSQNSKTRTLSPSLSPFHASKSNSNEKCSPLEMSFGCARNEKGDLWSVDRSQQSGAVPNHLKSSNTDSYGHCSMMKVRKRRGQVADYVSRDNNKTGVPEESQGIYGHVRSAMIGVHDNGEVIVPVSSSGLGIGETVISFSSSSGSELPKIVDVQDPKSNSLQCSDKFQVPLFRTEARAASNEPGLLDDHEMYRNVVGAERLQFGTGDSDFNVGSGSSFPEVDPIPIPGPPGSDLPSFSDMGSEDLRRNSSLSGSLAQSSGDGDYVVDGDLSDSPLSATSTISNMGIKDDHIVSESSMAALPVPDNIYSGWSGASSEPMVGTTAMFTQFAVAGTERFASVVDSSNESVVAQGKSPLNLQGDSQQCSCSRKEGIPWSSTLNFEESQLLGPMGTMMTTLSGKHTSSILNRKTSFLDNRTAALPISICKRAELEDLAYPAEKSHHGRIPVDVPAEAGVSFPRPGDCDSVGPSAPILRLMGKDLMVIKKEKDDLSRDQAGRNACTSSQVLPVSELSSRFPGWQHQSSQSTVSMAPTILEQDLRTFAMSHFDFGSLNMLNNSRESKQASGGETYVNNRMHANFTIPSSSPHQR